LDFLVSKLIVVEVKAVDFILPVHSAQLLSYLRLGGWKLGLMINFHVPVLLEANLDYWRSQKAMAASFPSVVSPLETCGAVTTAVSVGAM
jgi:hypothetical protein